MNTTPLNKWFALKEERSTFSLHPQKDREHFFGVKKWENEMKDSLQRSLVTQKPVRMLWWGGYGIGKTHRLHHIGHIIETNTEPEYPFQPYIPVCSDIGEKTPFTKLIENIMVHIQKETINALCKEYRDKAGQEGFPHIKDWCKSECIPNAFVKMGMELDSDEVSIAWQYITGQKITSQDAKVIKVDKTQIDSSWEYVDIISTVGHLFKRLRNKQLFIMLDEAENLGRLQSKAASSTWRESIRYLLDEEHISMAFAIGAETPDQVPAIFTNADIIRRIQVDNVKTLAALEDEEIREYLMTMFGCLIDPEARGALEAGGEMEMPPDYNSDLFPFANQAVFEQFIEYISEKRQDAKPSAINDKLETVAFRAHQLESRLITLDHLSEISG